MIASRMSDLPPTSYELDVGRGHVGEEWRLRLAAQADSDNDERWSDSDGD